jgi:hypothetical protein
LYHPQVCAAAALKLEDAYKCALKPSSQAEVQDFTSRLRDAVDSKGRPRRPLSREEQAFIQNELLLCKVDFRYAAERYFIINIEGREAGPMCPLMESQELILKKIAELELQCFLKERQDGILIDVLKARQVGESTLSQSMGAHRFITQNDIFGLVASDEPDNSGYLFDILYRIVSSLPWFLKPRIVDDVKNAELSHDGGTHFWVDSGKTTRGTEGARGQLGRGKALSYVHLSELSTWENTDQISGSLMPTIHPNPRVLVHFESTAKGRNNYWHKHWNAAVKGASRFTPIFIPWYAETRKYRANPPADWIPNAVTLTHGKKCEAEGERWVGHPVRITREQLYWYELKRREYEEEDRLATFLEEYCSDPEEAFQYAGRGIFSALVIDRIERQKKPLLGAFHVGPAGDIMIGDR